MALPSIWKVRALKGRDKWQQVLLCPYFHGQGIPQRRTGEIKRPADYGPELLVGNALGLRVEGHEAPGVQRVLEIGFQFRRRELHRAARLLFNPAA